MIVIKTYSSSHIPCLVGRLSIFVAKQKLSIPRGEGGIALFIFHSNLSKSAQTKL